MPRVPVSRMTAIGLSRSVIPGSRAVVRIRSFRGILIRTTAPTMIRVVAVVVVVVVVVGIIIIIIIIMCYIPNNCTCAMLPSMQY